MSVEAARILRALPVSGEHLLRYLGCELNSDDQSVTGARVHMARLVSSLQASPARPEIEQHLAEIDAMSDWLGQTCLREAVRAEAPELFDDLMQREGAHERAALVQFARPKVFEGACRRRYFSRHRLQRKTCARFRTISKSGWEPSEGDLRALLAALEPVLHDALRTGESIIVNPIIRSASGTGAFVQLSLYAAGAAQRIEEVEGLDLVQRVIRPAFGCVSSCGSLAGSARCQHSTMWRAQSGPTGIEHAGCKPAPKCRENAAPRLEPSRYGSRTAPRSLRTELLKSTCSELWASARGTGVSRGGSLRLSRRSLGFGSA